MPTYRMIYLGNFPDIDPKESTVNSEHATFRFAHRTVGTDYAPLYQNVVDVSMNDTNRDGRLYHDNYRGTQEKISYQLGDPPKTHSHELDGAFVAQKALVTRLLPDGSTDEVFTTVRVFQDTSGNTFMIPPPSVGGTYGEVAAVTTYPIVSVKMPAARYFETDLGVASTSRYDLKTFVPCFAAGTLIETGSGEVAVEKLRIGDMVRTRDHGLQPLRWRGVRRLSAGELRDNPKLRPIRIAAGALGPGQPSRDLVVSPQHRVLVQSRIAGRMFGSDQLLVPACRLVGMPGIAHDMAPGEVSYLHLMFDRHEVLCSNGAETESLYPGPQALDALGPEAVAEIRAIFPELLAGAAPPAGARIFATGRRIARLVERHLRNGKPLHA